jgi:hypothetical protein
MKQTIITILAAASVLAVAQEPMKLPIFNSSGGMKAHLTTKEEVGDLIWALKAAMRQFQPELTLDEALEQQRGAYTFIDEDKTSPAYLRRQAALFEAEAKAAEQREADRKRAYEILSKWEQLEKELSE